MMSLPGDQTSEVDPNFPPSLMNPTPLFSPWPQRPHKRPILEADDEYHHQDSKRQRLFPDLEPFTRSRSDSFLASTMTTRPSRDTRRPARYVDDLAIDFPARTRTPSIISQIHSPSVSFPSPVFTPISIPESRSSTNTRSASVTYREDLQFHGICLEPPAPPAEIIKQAEDILNRQRTSPTLSVSEVNLAHKGFRNLRQSGDEASIKTSYVHYKIIPHIDEFPGIELGSDRQFEGHALPHQNLGPPLSLPKPDNHYSFQVSEFTSSQQVKQNSRSLYQYSAPSSAGRWPFFIIEFKSQAKGGTIWHAENQAAAGGAILTNSMQKLFAIVDQSSEQIDTINFSCTIDARHAAFWVHYFAAETKQYCSVEVSEYSMKNTEHIKACRNTMRNIMGWALTTRLPTILKTLDGITIEYLEANEKAQLGRSAPIQESGRQKRRA